MFTPEVGQKLLKLSTEGRCNDMENMDSVLNYDNNEFMTSDFFDTIRSVESGIQDEFLSLGSPIDDFITSSDSSSHVDGSISPMNDMSESERSGNFTDDSVSPFRTMDTIDDGLLFDLLQSAEDHIAPVNDSFVVKQEPKPSKIIIQNPVTKKIVNKTITNPSQIKKIGKKQILKVQTLTTSNGKPVILPFGLKSIKIFNASDLKNVTALPATQVVGGKRKMEAPRFKGHHRNGELSEVKLTQEEKRLLEKEGIQLPAHHPLTKLEDRELKRIRRKIRNKISAQDSRKRKKEYVDGLEEKVRRGSEENRNLMQRVRELQKKNKTLMAHIGKLQSLIFNSTSSKATPSTCLMIVMLSVLLVSIPNIKLPQQQQRNEVGEVAEQVTISRSLLSMQKSDEDSLNMEEFFVFNNGGNDDNENNTENEMLYKTIEEMCDNNVFDKSKPCTDDKYRSESGLFHTFMENMNNLLNNNLKHGDKEDFHTKNGFIEPDIDEYEYDVYEVGPPMKRMKIGDDVDENFFPNVVVHQANPETKNQ